MNRVKGTDKNGDALRDWQELEAITPQGQKGQVEGMVPSRPGQSCSMGDGSLTGAVDRHRGMQLLPKPCGGWGSGGIIFLELFVFHFLISCQRLHWVNSTRRQRAWKAGSQKRAKVESRPGGTMENNQHRVIYDGVTLRQALP